MLPELHFFYITQHLCQRSFYKIFEKFRNSKKNVFKIVLIIVNIYKHKNKSLISNQFSLKNDFAPISWRTISRLVIGTSRTVGSAKIFVRITSDLGGGEFTKTLCKVCTCQKLKFAFLLLEYCKIRECYAVANAFTIRNMHSLLLYMKCNSRKINRPTKNMTKIVTLLHFRRTLWKSILKITMYMK